MEVLSPQGLAGYRQRLERIVREIPKSRGKVDLGGKVAAFVAQRYQEQTGQVVVEVRVVNTSWPAGVKEMALPMGHWGWPPLAQVSQKRQKEWYHGKLVAGQWVEVKADRAPKAVLGSIAGDVGAVVGGASPGAAASSEAGAQTSGTPSLLLAGENMAPTPPKRPKRVIRLPALPTPGRAEK